jgi:hypothetical protein
MPAPDREIIRIDTQGTLAEVLARFERAPEGIARAQRRAAKKLETYARRQVLRAASQASGATQKVLLALIRFRASRVGDMGLSIWVGTNPIKLHHLGTVSWTQRKKNERTGKWKMTKGARVGRKVYPGTWSWGRGKTGPAVMERTGDTRLPIDVVRVDIHDAIRTKIDAIIPEIAARYETLLAQELRYALELETRAA